MIFTERSGKLRYLNLKTMKSHEISGAPKVWASGQGGLLDVYMDHKTSDLYLTYSEPVGKEATPL
jgi:glucose/arabinose dehydrogenase